MEPRRIALASISQRSRGGAKRGRAQHQPADAGKRRRRLRPTRRVANPRIGRAEYTGCRCQAIFGTKAAMPADAAARLSVMKARLHASVRQQSCSDSALSSARGRMLGSVRARLSMIGVATAADRIAAPRGTDVSCRITGQPQPDPRRAKRDQDGRERSEQHPEAGKRGTVVTIVADPCAPGGVQDVDQRICGAEPDLREQRCASLASGTKM